MNNKEKSLPSAALLKIGKIGDIIENFYLVISSVVLVIFFSAVVLDVGARTMNNSLFWTQDTAIFSYFWCVFIAGAICVRRNEHFSIELFHRLPRVAKMVKTLLVMAVMFVFTYYLTRYGWDYAIMCWGRKQSASGLRLFYAIICMPLAGIGFAYFLVEQLILLFTGRNLAEISPKHAAKAEKEEQS